MARQGYISEFMNGLPAHQIKQNTKDKLSQAKWIFGLKTNRSVIKGEAYYV